MSIEKSDIRIKYQKRAERARLFVINSYYDTALDYGAHGSSDIIVDDTVSIPRITVQEEKNWNGYSKACRYPMVERNVVLHLPVTKGHKDLSRDLDGCSNLLSARQIGRSNVYDCYSIKKNRGIDYTISHQFIAVHDSMTYHSDTKKGAIEGLARKIKKQNTKSKDVVLRLDKKISKRLFKKITGACHSGIEQFCNTHNIDTDSVLLSDVIDIVPVYYRDILTKHMEQGAVK